MHPFYRFRGARGRGGLPHAVSDAHGPGRRSCWAGRRAVANLSSPAETLPSLAASGERLRSRLPGRWLWRRRSGRGPAGPRRWHHPTQDRRWPRSSRSPAPGRPGRGAGDLAHGAAGHGLRRPDRGAASPVVVANLRSGRLAGGGRVGRRALGKAGGRAFLAFGLLRPGASAWHPAACQAGRRC